MAQYLDPIVTERQKPANINVGDQTDEHVRISDLVEHFGNRNMIWGQNDFLQWCLDEGKGASMRQLAQHVLSFNLASLHVSAFRELWILA